MVKTVTGTCLVTGKEYSLDIPYRAISDMSGNVQHIRGRVECDRVSFCPNPNQCPILLSAPESL